jgi:hypothetical protein
MELREKISNDTGWELAKNKENIFGLIKYIKSLKNKFLEYF